LFSGLPSADPLLDGSFREGQFSSDIEEYDTNLESCGIRSNVDLIVGDARETLLLGMKGQGFVLAFLDVDVYEVMRKLLSQLWSESKGDEVVVVHDFGSLGIRKAVDEFSIETNNTIGVERLFGGGTAKITFPPLTVGHNRMISGT
jgi:hypothetical protein